MNSPVFVAIDRETDPYDVVVFPNAKDEADARRLLADTLLARYSVQEMIADGDVTEESVRDEAATEWIVEKAEVA